MVDTLKRTWKLFFGERRSYSEFRLKSLQEDLEAKTAEEAYSYSLFTSCRTQLANKEQELVAYKSQAAQQGTASDSLIRSLRATIEDQKALIERVTSANQDLIEKLQGPHARKDFTQALQVLANRTTGSPSDIVSAAYSAVNILQGLDAETNFKLKEAGEAK